MITIIDYRMGNLRSVQKAFERVGTEAQVVSSPEPIARAEKLVLPGVGAFADGMKFLSELGFVAPIRAFLKTGRPFLGICIGMQVLFEGSEEDAPSPDEPVRGLGILPGQVVRFQEDRGEKRLKVPHMGWNTIRWERDDPLFAGLERDCEVYFVHSYYGKPLDRSCQSAVSDYGGDFCASVWHHNIWATQFHPEKSQRVGLSLMANFAGF